MIKVSRKSGVIVEESTTENVREVLWELLIRNTIQMHPELLTVPEVQNEK